jgi:hypothetical protein
MASKPAATELLRNSEEETIPRLALRPSEAARAIGISERSLWTLTESGLIPCLRFGRSVLYSVDVLRDVLRARSAPLTNEQS